MPIAGHCCGREAEGPAKIAPIQAAQHVLILSDVDAVIQVDEIGTIVSPKDISRVTITVEPDRSDCTCSLVAPFYSLHQIVGERLVRCLKVSGNKFVLEQETTGV